MGIIDTLSGLNITNVNSAFFVVLTIIMWILVAAFIWFGALLAIRFIRRRKEHRAEIFEIRNGKPVYLGEDKVGVSRVGGVDMAVFEKFKYRSEFKNVKFPGSGIQYELKKGASKLFATIEDGQLSWSKIEWSDNPGLKLNPMPSDQKQNYMHQMELNEKTYGGSGWFQQNWHVIALAAVILANIIFVFFQWQISQGNQQVAIDSTHALTDAVNNLAQGGFTVPAAP